jgi:hypothetical protein
MSVGDRIIYLERGIAYEAEIWRITADGWWCLRQGGPQGWLWWIRPESLEWEAF